MKHPLMMKVMMKLKMEARKKNLSTMKKEMMMQPKRMVSPKIQ